MIAKNLKNELGETPLRTITPYSCIALSWFKLYDIFRQHQSAASPEIDQDFANWWR